MRSWLGRIPVSLPLFPRASFAGVIECYEWTSLATRYGEFTDFDPVCIEGLTCEQYTANRTVVPVRLEFV